VVKACYAESDSDLAEAERLLEGAQALNPEETGVLLVLGEISVLRGDYKKAEQRLAAVCQTNAKAVGGFFLRGFLAVQAGREDLAVTFLEAARAALGKDWQPKGSTGEGDVKQKQHVEQTPLTHFWEEWDGEPDPRMAFKSLAEYLKRETRKP
jgi:hypothetical protein